MSELLDLNWDVFVTPGIPTVTSALPPGTKQQMWSPISSTLIYGKRDAVLVDAFITAEQADAWNVIVPLLQSGAIKPIVAKTFPLAEAADALRYLVEDRPFGRVVLTI